MALWQTGALSRPSHMHGRSAQAVPPSSTSLDGFFGCASQIMLVLYLITAVLCWQEWYRGYPHFAAAFPIGKDFINFYSSSRLMLSGSLSKLFNPYLYSKYLSKTWEHVIPPGQYVWSYPPTMLLFTLPFGLTRYSIAFVAWAISGFAIYAFAVRQLGFQRQQIGWLALAPASLLNLYFGQTGFLLSGLILLSLAIRQRFPIVAGVLLGLAAVKPQLLPLVGVLLLAECRWRMIVATSLSIATAVSVSILLTPAAWMLFFHITIPIQAAFLKRAPDPSHLQVWQVLTVSPFMALRLMQTPLHVAYVAQVLATLLAMGGCFWAARSADSELRVAAVLTGACLASPYMMAYDLTLLSPACLLLARHPAFSGRMCSMLLRLSWLAPGLCIMFNRLGTPLIPLLIGILFCTILQMSRKRQNSVAAE